MEEITKVHVDWKKIAVVGFLVLLTGLVAAGATWYVGEMFHQAELEVKDEEISTLETRIEQLEAELTEDEETESAETEPTTEESTETEEETETETKTPDTTTNN